MKLEALNRALGHRQIAPDQLLIHTDQGRQYRATAYRQLLEGRKIPFSMSIEVCALLGQQCGGGFVLHS